MQNRAMPTEVEQVIQKQLDAYNAHDIEAFMAMWAGDALYFEHPATLLASGAEAIRARHVARFQEANLFARLNQRMVLGNKVVDQETVTRTFPEGTGTIDVIVTYEVINGKVARAWYIFGIPVLDRG
ncbi:MAG: nuclear transport factor 2 family protein [Alphaproteobacteria bacterium]